MTLTFTDMFCGAGGSSIGASIAGAELRMGLNHWPVAIETHAANFPNAGHDCADISQANPRRYPRTNILLASPECTNHSLAKGARRRKPQAASLWSDGPPGDDEQERSRSTMWDVVRFTEVHAYDAVIVENVVDAAKWGPRDDGQLFEAWLAAMRALDYEHEIVYLNSMFAGPVPQSRDRMYVVFWRRGITRPDLDIRPVSWCPECEGIVRGRQAWKRPDARRWGRYGPQYVYACPDCHGIVHPGAVPAAEAIDWSLPAQRIGDRERPLATRTLERIQRGLARLAAEPFALQEPDRGLPRPLTLPLVPLHAHGAAAMTTPVAGNTYERSAGNRARDVRARPADTVHATLDRAIVVPPSSNGKTSDPAAAPAPTQTTETRPMLVMANREHGVPRAAERDPSQTACTGHGGGLAVVELQQNGGARDATARPAHTVRAGGQHHGIVTAHYTPGWNRLAHDEPVGPVTTRDSHSLTFPPSRWMAGARDVQLQPVHTVLGSDGGHALVVPYRRSVPPRDASTTPAHTISTVESAAIAWDGVDVEDCRFRMFELPEIAATMAMLTGPNGEPYHVTGNKRERMRQYGNAVTPPAMQLLVGRVVDALNG